MLIESFNKKLIRLDEEHKSGERDDKNEYICSRFVKCKMFIDVNWGAS